MAVVLLVVLALLAINGVCVAAEYAVVASRRSRMRTQAEAGSRNAARLLHVLTEPAAKDTYISGCQLGITVTSLALGAVTEGGLAAAVAPWFASMGSLSSVAAHTVAVTVLLVLLSFLQVTFAEVLPKAIALRHPNRVAMATFPMVRMWLRVLRWPIRLFTAAANGVLRLLRLPRAARDHVYSSAEIQLLIRESHRGGMLDAATSSRMIEALGLRERPVRRLMVPRPRMFAVDIDQQETELVAAVMGGKHTRIPAFRGSIDAIVGTLHTKDLALRQVDGGTGPIEDLVRPVLFVPETAPADRLLADMRGRNVAQAIVVDEFGGTVGLITLEDLLADVVGAVRRPDARVPRPEPLPGGWLRLPGAMRLDEAAELVRAPWAGYANTVGGYVVEQMGRLPERGERVRLAGVATVIEDVARHTVLAVRVRPLSDRPAVAGGGR